MAALPRSRTVEINPKVVELVESVLGTQTQHKKKFGTYVNEAVYREAKRETMPLVLFPSLMKSDVKDGNVIIYDIRKGAYAKVHLTLDNELYCEGCKKFWCRHVRYTYLLPEFPIVFEEIRESIHSESIRAHEEVKG